MPCALCLKDEPLQRSHIYPDWIYQPLYDEKHRVEVLSVVPDGRNEWHQTGMNERLLCYPCEQKFSVWEGYARKVFTNPSPAQVRVSASLIQLVGLDYRRLRLFELSIIWRAGVSTLPFFERCQLGPHAEVMRQALDASEPGSPDRYGVLLFRLKAGERPETLQLIAEPRVAKTPDGGRAYNLTFAGHLWLFSVSGRLPPPAMQACFLRPEGTRLVSEKDALQMGNLAAFATKLRSLGRAPRGA